MSKERFAIRIDGKVQGVWFRKYTSDKANSLGLSGFTQNEAGGSVYVEAEGSSEKLTQLLCWCLQGPEQASVKGMTIVKIPVTGQEGAFEILD